MRSYMHVRAYVFMKKPDKEDGFFAKVIFIGHKLETASLLSAVIGQIASHRRLGIPVGIAEDLEATSSRNCLVSFFRLFNCSNIGEYHSGKLM